MLRSHLNWRALSFRVEANVFSPERHSTTGAVTTSGSCIFYELASEDEIVCSERIAFDVGLSIFGRGGVMLSKKA